MDGFSHKQIDMINDLIEHITNLSQLITTKYVKPERPMRSEQINELFGALAKAQSEMKIANESTSNPYFKSKYADLEEIVKASRPYLAKNGLAVIQQIMANEDGTSVLNTILSHSSGQWIESRMRIISQKADIQSVGSAITYVRRYSYAAMVGVVAGGEDDDGETVMAPQRQLYARGTAETPYKPREQSMETITKEQLEELEDLLAFRPDLAEMMLNHWKIQSFADMPKSAWKAAITRAREIKISDEAARSKPKDPSITEL